MTLAAYRSVTLQGTIVPSDALTRAADLTMPGQRGEDYNLTPGLTVNNAVARAWNDLSNAWTLTQRLLETTAPDKRNEIFRDKWIMPLLRELGYVPEATRGGIDLPPGLGETRPVHYTIGHHQRWTGPGNEPTAGIVLQIVGAHTGLDKKTAGVTARAPHALTQEFLNRTPVYLYGLLTNGTQLRLLRDVSSLAKQTLLDFDLDLMFREGLFGDFRLLWLTLHASRLTPRTIDLSSADEQEPSDPVAGDCWLETWRATVVENGTRARDQLERGVAAALTALGTGFVRHPANDQLRTSLANVADADNDLRKTLLKVVYRFIVLFVAEDRDLLHTGAHDTGAQAGRDLYAKHFSTVRLRHLAATRQGTRHHDLWPSHLLVTDALGSDGQADLDLPALSESLYSRSSLGLLADAQISNRWFLEAVRHLSRVQDPITGHPVRIDYRNLDSEELGGIYEGLLAYVPHYDPDAREFTLSLAAGSDRKTSGAFYTGQELISLILDETLNPLIDEALRDKDPETAILNLTVCDPACGSGHFLVAAARRLARSLATIRTGDPEPSPPDQRAAMRDVVARCIYGVDLNDLALEVAKVALWLEALTPGKPFAYLDHHLKVGNALLGATPALVAKNIPDAAFAPLLGDDTKRTSKLRARNKTERRIRERQTVGQFTLDMRTLDLPTAQISKRAQDLDFAVGETIEQVRAAADAWRRLDADPELAHARLIHDAWCAAFVQSKPATEPPYGITDRVLADLNQQPGVVIDDAKDVINELARQYRFFHWHLEFPGIFTVPDSGTAANGHGWNGGFSVVIGNPPWETLSPDTREFFAQLVPEIRTLAKSEKETRIAELLTEPVYAARWERHQRELFATAHMLKRSGRYVMYAEGNLGKGDFNTYRSFIELALTHTRRYGYAGQVVQSGIFAGANVSAIRQHLLSDCTWTAVYGCDNKGGTWFPGVTLENFGAYAARCGLPPPAGHELRAAFGLHSPSSVQVDIAQRLIRFDTALIREQNPDTLAIPDIRDAQLARISRDLYRAYPGLGTPIDGLPSRDFSTEQHMNDRKGVFGADPAGVPIYEGRMIDFYDHRAKTYVSGHGNSSVWQQQPFGTTSKQIVPQWRVLSQDLANDDVRERIKGFRIAFMDIADPGRQRSFVCAYVPPGTVCGHTVPTLTFDQDWYGPIYLAIANSLAIDLLARQRCLSKHMTFSILDSLPIARLSKEDRRSAWLVERALLLTCTSVDMTPLWNSMAEHGWVTAIPGNHVPGVQDPDERRRLRADIDAYVAQHVYNLRRDDFERIISTFTQLEGIEIKAHGEFLTKRLVLDAYDRLANTTTGGGIGHTSSLTPVPGDSPRHPER